MTQSQSTPGWLVTLVIVRRELILFVRQPARIAAAIGTPCLFWLFMASGFAQSLKPEHLGDTTYGTFLLPGMMTLVAVFAAIFSSISTVYRNIIRNGQQCIIGKVMHTIFFFVFT